MKQQNLFKGRDKRRKGWFWMDNDYLNGYAKYFGPVGTAIYVSLCRHADNETQKCFPAMKLIAEELGCGTTTIKKHIKLFEKYHLISVEREKDMRTKKWLNNVYTMLDKEEWINPGSPDTPGNGKSQGHLITKPGTPNDKSQGRQVSNKETHINKTHIKEEIPSISGKQVNDFIYLFKEVNPSYEQLFKRKNQHEAMQRLIKKHGEERITKIMDILPQTNKMQYAPTIITPIQLEDKLGSVIAFIQKEQIKVGNQRVVKIS